MSKLKRITSDGMTQIVVKAKSGQQLNQREAQMILDGSAQGFLLFDAVTKGSSFKLVYSLYDLIPLPQYLQMTVMSGRMFGRLLRMILDAVKRLDTYRFSKDLLQFDLNCVMISPENGQIYLLYIPIQPYAAEGTLKEMLLDIVRYASFDPRENLSYVQEYIRIINDGVVFSAFTLDAYVDALTGVNPSKPTVPEAAPAAAPIATPSSFVAAAPIVEPAARIESIPDVPVLNLSGAFDEAEAEEVSEPQPAKEEIPAVPVLPEAPVLSPEIGAGFEENDVTVCKAMSADGALSTAWLERKGDPRRYEIARSPYRIGKMREGNDHQIQANTVSRKHAEILLERGHYYLVDLNSTNGTYLDGRRIGWNQKEELQNGAVIRFANEEFIFYTK